MTSRVYVHVGYYVTAFCRTVAPLDSLCAEDPLFAQTLVSPPRLPSAACMTRARVKVRGYVVLYRLYR